jgi:hypothetical protein
MFCKIGCAQLARSGRIDVRLSGRHNLTPDDGSVHVRKPSLHTVSPCLTLQYSLNQMVKIAATQHGVYVITPFLHAFDYR